MAKVPGRQSSHAVIDGILGRNKKKWFMIKKISDIGIKRNKNREQ